MRKIALITGASAGIGKAIAFDLAAAGYDLIITGRRENRLLEVKKQIAQKHNRLVFPLSFDIQDKDAVAESLNNLPDSWNKINVLVNNAGLALGMNTFHEADTNDWDTMIDTNVKGLLYVSRLISKKMVDNKIQGQIVNVGSTAGKQAYGKGHVYCATKFAVDAITKAMRIDLLPYKIRVSSVCPGAVNTEFSTVRFKGDKNKANQVYKGYQPLKAEDIAQIVVFVLSRPPHVSISDIVVTPTAQADAYHFLKDA